MWIEKPLQLERDKEAGNSTHAGPHSNFFLLRPVHGNKVS